MAVHFQEGIKMQCKQTLTFLAVFICGNKFCFQHGNLFCPKLRRFACALLWFIIHHCLYECKG